MENIDPLNYLSQEILLNLPALKDFSLIWKIFLKDKFYTFKPIIYIFSRVRILQFPQIQERVTWMKAFQAEFPSDN